MTHKQFAISLAKRAGKIMLANFGLGMQRIMKKDGSPVTKTDLAINKMVVDEVAKYFPGHGVLGEEQSSLIANSKYTWVCDPVDGTIPFSHGMPTCMFSLALTRRGQPILGVAFDPFLNRMFWAEKGKGAFLNGKKIHVSSHKQLKGAYISHGVWPTMKFQTPHFIYNLVFKKRAEFFPIGSIVYNCMLLAAGELEGAVFAGATTHDVAAIKIIVEEAGGKVTDVFGHEQRYDLPVKGCIITNGKIHGQLLKFFKDELRG